MLLACGGGRSTLELPSPVAHTSAPSLDFGLADCGGSGDPRTVTLTNDATALPLTWTAKVDGPYALQGPTSGQLFSHESATVTVLPEVPTTADAAFPVTGTLRFSTNDPAHPSLEIPLSAIARGATLSFPASVDFGDVPLSATSPAVPLTVQNMGNLAADVAFGLASGSDFAPGSASVHAEAGGSESALFHFAPTAWGPENASLLVTVKGPTCGVVPSAIPLLGRGTKGVVLTSPGSLDFGLVDCGTQGGAKVVHVQNLGDALFAFDATLATGTAYSVSPSHASVAPGATVDVTVSPVAVPSVSAVTPDLYADTLTIKTDALGDALHIVALHETARGAILGTLGVTAWFGGAIVDDPVFPIWGNITNTGNVTVSVTGSSPEGAAIPSPLVVPQNGISLAMLTLRLDPTYAPLGKLTSASVHLALASSAPLCAPLPELPFQVTAWDHAIDLAMGSSLCAVGHSHRGYCLGQMEAGEWTSSLYPVAQSNEFIVQPGIVAEHVALTYGRICWSLGTQLRCVGFNTDVLPPNPYAPVVQNWGFPGPIAEVSGGGYYDTPVRFFVRVAGGGLFAWRNEAFGEFGDGFETSVGPLAAMGSLGDATSATLGRHHGCASTTSGSVLCAGTAAGYELGGPTGKVFNPVVVPGVSARRIDAQNDSTCAAQLDGTVVCWSTDRPPTPIPGITDAVDVHVWGRWDYGCAVRSGGGARCWSFDSLNGFVLTDVAMQGISSAKKIVTGSVQVPANATACILRNEGAISCMLDPHNGATNVPGFF